MKAKKVYEFRTSGEIVKMGKSAYIEKEIEGWIEQIQFNNNVNYKYYPDYDTLVISGMVVIANNNIIKFPNIEHIIILDMFFIDDVTYDFKMFPNNLTVFGDLFINRIDTESILKWPKESIINNFIIDTRWSLEEFKSKNNEHLLENLNLQLHSIFYKKYPFLKNDKQFQTFLSWHKLGIVSNGNMNIHLNKFEGPDLINIPDDLIILKEEIINKPTRYKKR